MFFQPEERQAFKPKENILNMKGLAGHNDGNDRNLNNSTSFAQKNLAVPSRAGAQKSAERRRVNNENYNGIEAQQTSGKQLPRYMQPIRREPRKSTVIAQSLDHEAYSSAIKNITRDLSPNTAMILSGRHRKDASPRGIVRAPSRPSLGQRQKSQTEINNKSQRSTNRTSCMSPDPMSPGYKEGRFNGEKSRPDSRASASRSSIGISTPISNIYRNLKEPSASKVPEESILQQRDKARKQVSRNSRRTMASNKRNGPSPWNQEGLTR